jgi:hypothetical protein
MMMLPGDIFKWKYTDHFVSGIDNSDDMFLIISPCCVNAENVEQMCNLLPNACVAYWEISTSMFLSYFEVIT